MRPTIFDAVKPGSHRWVTCRSKTRPLAKHIPVDVVADLMEQSQLAEPLIRADDDADWLARSRVEPKATEFGEAFDQAYRDPWEVPVPMHSIDRRDHLTEIVVGDPSRYVECPADRNARRSHLAPHSTPAAQSIPRSTIVRASGTSKSCALWPSEQ